MTILLTTLLGFLLGLAYFGGLWVSVQRMLHARAGRSRFAASRALRLALFAAVVTFLSMHTGASALGVLPGFWLARFCAVRFAAEVSRGRY